MPPKKKPEEQEEQEDGLELREATEELTEAPQEAQPAEEPEAAAEEPQQLQRPGKADDDRGSLGPPLELDELIAGGYLQEANRIFFHPLGLALAVIEDRGQRSLAVLDARDDAEGIYFEDDPDSKKAQRVVQEWDKKARARLTAFGWVKQPTR